MAITLVNTAPPSSTGNARSSNTLSADDGGMAFGALLSQQIPGFLPLNGDTFGNEALLGDKTLLENGALPDSSELLAGMLAVSPTSITSSGASSNSEVSSGPQDTLTMLSESRNAGQQPDAKLSSLLPKAEAIGPEQIASFAARNNSAATIAASTPLQGEANSGDFAASLAMQAGNQTNSARHAETQAPLTLSTPIGDERWANSFSDRIVWLAKNDQQSAQLNINPPQLGPVQINLKLNGDQATAIFTSPHADVRQAIEDAMPRLREVLASAGIELGQTNVGAQMANQERGNPNQTADSPRFISDKAILRGDAGQSDASSVTALRSGRGLVDLFA